MKHLLSLIYLLAVLCTAACAPMQKPSVQDPQNPNKQEELEKNKPQNPPQIINPVKPDPKPEPKPEPKPKPKPVVKPKPQAKPNPADKKDNPPQSHDFIIIGETEYIYIDALKMRLQARIDTGAATSSLSAATMQPFERDGQKWVRFTVALADGKTSAPIERPLRRTVSIKRHGSESQKRPVVELKVRMGTLHMKTEFTLTDRSNFEYPILIGRTFLRGNIIVDVSRKNLTSPMSE